MKLAFTSATANRRHQLILHTTLRDNIRVLNSVWVIWIGVKIRFRCEDLNLVWAIWNRCERFEFGASILEFGASVFEFGVSAFEFGVSVFEFGVNNLNLVWVFRIRWEWFQFSVSDSNSVWVIWIWCEWFKFGVHLYRSVSEIIQMSHISSKCCSTLESPCEAQIELPKSVFTYVLVQCFKTVWLESWVNQGVAHA